MTRWDSASEITSPVVVLSGGGGGARLAGALSGRGERAASGRCHQHGG